jgi:kinesin family protein 2/24
MVITTEQFMLENASRYQRLVKDVKFPSKPVQKTITQTNPDVVICTRIRPLLEQETEQGIPEGVFVRGTTNSTIDAHELRQMVRGPPVLKVCGQLTTRSPD